MTADEITALVLGSLIIIIGGIMLVMYLIKIAPRLAEVEESRINKELIKARAEIRQKKKLINAMINELAQADEKIEDLEEQIKRAEKYLIQNETERFMEVQNDEEKEE